MKNRKRGALTAPWLCAAAIALALPASANAVQAATNLKVTAVTGSSVSLGWTASPDAAGYRVWRGDGNWQQWQLVKDLTGRSTSSYVDGGLAASTGYTYVVRAYDAGGNVPSNGVPARTASTTSSTTPAGKLFSASSVWNAPIPASPVLDTKSATWASYLAQSGHVADLYEFGTAIYEPPAGTSRYSVRTLNAPGWGLDPFAGQTVPLKAGFVPSFGSDAAMAVIDWSTRRSYEFWRYDWNGGSPYNSWGGIASVDGEGNGSGATGSGISRIAGVVRAKEMAAGVIDHALVFGSDNNCKGVYRYPATKTDGGSTASACLPEGARVQLDPAVNVDSIAGITPAEKIVARALQKYGAVLNDNAGARMAFAFEAPTDESDPYPATGLSWDYYNMTKIPWSRLRVLRRADGG